MLEELGVKGARVQEVLGLDTESLGMLPYVPFTSSYFSLSTPLRDFIHVLMFHAYRQPIFGLIFLFRYSPDDAGSQETVCPNKIWFANQVSGNSCATVALLNVVCNVPGVWIGDELKRFKDFSAPFTPALRGDQVAHSKFIKGVHNTFAR